MSSRVWIAVLALAMIAATAVGGIAADGGGSGTQNAAESQYDPPTCPNGERVDNNCGNGQGPGNNQGQGRTECPNGQPFPNCGRSPQEANEAKARARQQCKADLAQGRADQRATKARNRKYLSRVRGAERRRLAKAFKAEERRQNSRNTRNYRACQSRAEQA